VNEGLTVVIPCRSATASLVACVTTLARQWPPDLPGGVVVVDDGSGDSYAEVIENMGVDVQLIRMPQQSGPAACRNAGVLASRWSWIAFLDDDCLVPWGWLQTLRAIAADPTPRLVGGRVRARRPRNVWSQAMEDFVLNPTWQDGVWHVITANCLVHRDTWAAVDGFDSRYRTAGGEDWDFSERVHGAGHRVEYEPGLWCFHENATTPGPFFERAVRYGRAHARWTMSRQVVVAQPSGKRSTSPAVSLVRRKGSFLVRRYRELRSTDASRARSLRSTVAFAAFLVVFDVAALRESRRAGREDP